MEYEARPIANDGKEANELVKSIIEQSQRLLVKKGALALCCSGGGGPGTIEFATWSQWMDQYLNFKMMIVQDKGPMGLGWHYRRSYEVVLVATKGLTCFWYDQSDKIENIIRPGDYGISKIIPSEDDHPTPKAVELATFFIRLHTKPGDTVLDPCMGAGWVAAACKQVGRKFIGIEIDPHWCRQSIKTLNAETPDRVEVAKVYKDVGDDKMRAYFQREAKRKIKETSKRLKKLEFAPETINGKGKAG